MPRCRARWREWQAALLLNGFAQETRNNSEAGLSGLNVVTLGREGLSRVVCPSAYLAQTAQRRFFVPSFWIGQAAECVQGIVFGDHAMYCYCCCRMSRRFSGFRACGE